jgi:excisionase family DNA binding protein
VEKLLDIDDVKALLKVSKATIYAWTSKGIIPHIKPSKGLVRFRESKILAWLEEKSVNVACLDDQGPKTVVKKKTYRKSRSISDSAVDRIVGNAKKAVLS